MNENNSKKDLEEPEFLNEYEKIKINGKEWVLPDQPSTSFTKSRVDNLRNDISVSPDHSRFSNVEDVPISIQDGRGQTSNQIDLVIEAENMDAEIFDELGFKEQSDASKDITVTRYVVAKNRISDLDRKTRVQLAKMADKVGDVYIMQPLIQSDGSISLQDIETYLNIAQELRQETDSLTIVPVLHLSDTEGVEARMFAKSADEELSTEKYPLIGITGSSPFANKRSFLNVRGLSEKKLMVTQCPKKLDGSGLEGLRPVSRSHFYLAKDAKVVLSKKWLPGGGGENDEDERLELVQESHSVFDKESCDNAESAIPEFVSFEGQRDEITESSSTKDFELLHNELAICEGTKNIREKLEKEEKVLNDRDVLRQAIDRF